MRQKAVVALCILLAAACHKAEDRTAPHTLLWTPSNGTPYDGPASFKDGSAVVRAKVDNVNPDTMIRQLVEHYASTRWALQSPGDREWVDFPGGGVIPTDAAGKAIKLQTKYWRAEWEDDGGNSIKYLLKETRIQGESITTIDVYGHYIPHSLQRLNIQ